MAGFGLFLYGALKAITSIGKAVENQQMKNYSYGYTDKGEPTWIDRECNQYINGEKVIATYDYVNKKLVYAGQKSGKVYIDPEQNQRDRLDRLSEERKRDAIKRGMLAYDRYDHVWKKRITTEILTGRPIAQLIRKSDGTYWKYYGRIDAPKFKGECYIGSQHTIDEPIQITREEFSALDIAGGSHFTYRG